jgi:hypothetical protein
MSAKLAKYRELRVKLLRIREANRDEDSKEEEEVLDEMDGVWYQMSPEEIAQIEKGPA